MPVSEPRRLAEILPKVAAALRARHEASGGGGQCCVVLHMSSRCDQWPEISCLMEVIYDPERGMTREQATEIARAVPDWTRPHVMRISTPDMWDAG